MITKTRLQFLAALFLVALPLLGIPAWLDAVLVSVLGMFIALTTFLTARERRLTIRAANMIDAPSRKEEDVAKTEMTDAPRPKRTRRKSVKKAVVPEPEEVIVEEPTPVPADQEEMEEAQEPAETEQEPDTTYGNEPVPSPIDPDAVIKKVSRRKVKTPVLVSDSEELE